MSTSSQDVYQKLSALGITLPPLAIPAAAYVPFVQTGFTVFFGDVAAQKNQLASLHKRNISCSWNCERWQRDAQRAELLINVL